MYCPLWSTKPRACAKALACSAVPLILPCAILYKVSSFIYLSAFACVAAVASFNFAVASSSALHNSFHLSVLYATQFPSLSYSPPAFKYSAFARVAFSNAFVCSLTALSNLFVVKSERTSLHVASYFANSVSIATTASLVTPTSPRAFANWLILSTKSSIVSTPLPKSKLPFSSLAVKAPAFWASSTKDWMFFCVILNSPSFIVNQSANNGFLSI